MPPYQKLGTFANPLEPFVNQALQAIAAEEQQFVNLAVATMVTEAVQAATRITSKQVAELAAAIERGAAPGERQIIHDRIAKQAQLSTLRSYDQTARRTNQQPGYRSGPNTKWRRYSGGRLRAALADPSFVSASPDGIEFGNIALLNKRAAQWARLNFGAGQRGSGSKPSTAVTINGLVVAALGLEEPARPGFMIPVGYFVNEEGTPIRPNASRTGVAFYPAGTGDRRYRGRTYEAADGKRRPIPMTARRTTRGIRARNFLDAGVARIAREIGPAYENLYRDLVERGEASVRPRRWVIKTHRVV